MESPVIAEAASKQPKPVPLIWTDPLVEFLTSLWDEGLSTAEIGRRMGISKNAVIGKAHRLNLPARPNPVKKRQQDTQQQKRQKPKGVIAMTPTPTPEKPSLPVQRDFVRQVTRPPVVMRLVSPPAPEPAPEPEAEALPAEAQPRQREGCRWIEGDTRGEWRYCDAPRSAIGSSWCAEHRARVFQPAKQAG